MKGSAMGTIARKPTPAQRNAILRYAGHESAKLTRPRDSTIAACIVAEWIEAEESGQYVTTEAGAWAAGIGIEFDTARYIRQMGQRAPAAPAAPVEPVEPVEPEALPGLEVMSAESEPEPVTVVTEVWAKLRHDLDPEAVIAGCYPVPVYVTETEAFAEIADDASCGLPAGENRIWKLRIEPGHRVEVFGGIQFNDWADGHTWRCECGAKAQERETVYYAGQAARQAARHLMSHGHLVETQQAAGTEPTPAKPAREVLPKFEPIPGHKLVMTQSLAVSGYDDAGALTYVPLYHWKCSCKDFDRELAESQILSQVTWFATRHLAEASKAEVSTRSKPAAKPKAAPKPKAGKMTVPPKPAMPGPKKSTVPDQRKASTPEPVARLNTVSVAGRGEVDGFTFDLRIGSPTRALGTEVRVALNTARQSLGAAFQVTTPSRSRTVNVVLAAGHAVDSWEPVLKVVAEALGEAVAQPA
ncbi:hypothetical protein GCM10010109_69060 [Actinoplanes campanulatus]|nr:hypothetical protein GCM10010109_69060 [Actinoplanes campanulatus]GID42411.1 hypothetical protein Aca09nite_89170 [Actinoplanes campanulatus]